MVRLTRYHWNVALVGVVWLAMSHSLSFAQRPVQTFDPFYRGETASRTFFDRYAVTGEISYRPLGLLQGDGIATGSVPSGASDPIGISFRFDYTLAHGLDIGAYMNASGNAVGRSLSINWLVLKYYRTQEYVDYAIRLAVDPASDSRSGFPQTDLAFLYNSTLSPTLRSDFAVGIRRVQLGYQQLVAAASPVKDPEDPIVSPPGEDREILRTRARGWEVHMTMGYQVLFDPAGSNMFITLMGEGGRYDMVEWTVLNPEMEPDERTTTSFNGGVVWARSGLQFDRPGYQLSPFLTLPLKQWVPSGEDYPLARPHIGLRLMLR